MTDEEFIKNDDTLNEIEATVLDFIRFQCTALELSKKERMCLWRNLTNILTSITEGFREENNND